MGFFKAQNAAKPVFGQGSIPDPAGGAYDAPPDDPLVGWGGDIHSPFCSPSMPSVMMIRRLASDPPPPSSLRLIPTHGTVVQTVSAVQGWPN